MYESSSEDEMTKAFDIDDNTIIPEGYQLDPLDKQCTDFILKTRKEKDFSKNQLKKEKEVPLKLNYNNNDFLQINIDNNWRNNVIDEFLTLKNQVESYKRDCKGTNKLTFDHLLDKFSLSSIKTAPDIRDIILLNNSTSIHLIEYLYDNLNNNIYANSLYIYFFLSFLDVPLVDDYCSVLYMLNKKLYFTMKMDVYDEKEKISMKIIHIIINDFFKQKLVIHNIK